MRSVIPNGVLLCLVLAGCSLRPVADSPDAALPSEGADASGPAVEPQPDAGIAPDASTAAGGPDASVPSDGCAGEVGEYYVEKLTGLLRIMARCNGMAEEGLLIVYPTQEGCAEKVRAVAGGRITYDRTQAAACLALIRANQITCDEMPASTGPCVDDLVGKVPVGGSCYGTGECLDFDLCSATPLACPGTCGARPGSGEPCPDQMCALGLECLDGTCREIGKVGDSCNPYRGPACPAYAWCDDSGKCAQRKTSGACQGDDECVLGYGCLRGTDGTRTCTQLKAPGQPCTVGANECMLLSYCVNGTCRVHPHSGEPCALKATATSERPFCLDGECDNFVCVPYLAPRDTCTDSYQCGKSGYAACDPGWNQCVGPCKPRR